MTKKILPLFALIALAACLFSYKLGSAPVALAKARATPQDTSGSATPLTLPAAPATWSLWAGGGNSTAGVIVTKPAGGAGVQHVATCVMITYFNNGATGFTGLSAYLDDGSNTLQGWNLAAPTGGSSSVNLCDLNIVGTANTPMTLNIGDNTNRYVTVGLVGYDAQ